MFIPTESIKKRYPKVILFDVESFHSVIRFFHEPSQPPRTACSSTVRHICLHSPRLPRAGIAVSAAFPIFQNFNQMRRTRHIWNPRYPHPTIRDQYAVHHASSERATTMQFRILRRPALLRALAVNTLFSSQAKCVLKLSQRECIHILTVRRLDLIFPV